MTDDEVRRCEAGFCEGAYLEAKRRWVQENNRTNPYSAHRSAAAVDAAFASRRAAHVEACRRNFCNPHCRSPDRATGRRARYVCPACTKDFAWAKQRGAITNCQKDPLF